MRGPRNQGASLTAWELGQHGVPHHVIVDNAGGHLMQHGKVVEKIHDLREAKDPYSKKLLASVFTIEEGKNKVLPDELFN